MIIYMTVNQKWNIENVCVGLIICAIPFNNLDEIVNSNDFLDVNAQPLDIYLHLCEKLHSFIMFESLFEPGGFFRCLFLTFSKSRSFETRTPNDPHLSIVSFSVGKNASR